jgi:hypothetical protein
MAASEAKILQFAAERKVDFNRGFNTFREAAGSSMRINRSLRQKLIEILVGGKPGIFSQVGFHKGYCDICK